MLAADVQDAVFLVYFRNVRRSFAKLVTVPKLRIRYLCCNGWKDLILQPKRQCPTGIWCSKWLLRGHTFMTSHTRWEVEFAKIVTNLNTVNSLISGGYHRCKKFCPLVGGVRLLESFFSFFSVLRWVPD